MPREELAPIRICWIKVLTLGVGTVPSDSVSVMESMIQPMRALLSDIRSALYCAWPLSTHVVEDSFHRGRCSCGVCSQGRPDPWGKGWPCVDVHFPPSPLLYKIDVMMLASELGQKYATQNYPSQGTLICKLHGPSIKPRNERREVVRQENRTYSLFLPKCVHHTFRSITRVWQTHFGQVAGSRNAPALAGTAGD